MTNDDSPDWFGDYSDRHLRIDTGFFEVVARDDDATLVDAGFTPRRFHA